MLSGVPNRWWGVTMAPMWSKRQGGTPWSAMPAIRRTGMLAD